MQELKEHNLQFAKLLSGPSQLNNWSRDSMRLEGEFVFARFVKKIKKTVTPSIENTPKKIRRRKASSAKPTSPTKTTATKKS